MTRKVRSDSAAAAVSAFGNAGSEIPLPDYVELRSEEERVIWNQFCKARSRDAWRDFDLVLLAKVVKLEADIRKHQQTLDDTGALIPNKRETLVENPLFRVIDTLQRQQMAIIRSMSLNQTDSDPRTLNATGLKEKSAAEVLKKVSVSSLIATPTRSQ